METTLAGARALIVQHRTKPGKRADVEQVWRRHMRPMIAANPGHLLYAYTFGADPDVVVAFQIYGSKQEADAFMRSAGYAAYLDEVGALIEHDPEITVVSPRWIKSAGTITDVATVG